MSQTQDQLEAIHSRVSRILEALDTLDMRLEVVTNRLEQLLRDISNVP